MGYLERFAREQRGNRSRTITARVDPDTDKRFKEQCDRLGLTVSEAVALLIEREVRGEAEGKAGEPEANRGGIHDEHEEKQMYTYSTQKHTPTRRQRAGKRSGGGGRFTYAPYVVKGKAPCPICRTWISRGNLARHMDQHDTNTEEAYKAHMETVEKMVEQAKGES